MFKALICLSLVTLAGAFSATKPSTKHIQTTDLVSVHNVVYFYGDGTQNWHVGCCVRFALRCGGGRNG